MVCVSRVGLENGGKPLARSRYRGHFGLEVRIAALGLECRARGERADRGRLPGRDAVVVKRRLPGVWNRRALLTTSLDVDDVASLRDDRHTGLAAPIRVRSDDLAAALDAEGR